MSSSVQSAAATYALPASSAYEPRSLLDKSRYVMQTTAQQPSGFIKPLLWIAGAFFATGFLGYLAIGLNSLPG